MALAPLLYNITFDSQTRILYFWDKAGHEIYHCEIASHAPSLPTVSVSGDFGTRNWLYAQPGGTVMSISAGESIDLYNATSSGYVKVLFDTSKKYAVLTWYSGTGSGDIGVNGSLSISNTGYIAAKNETNSSLSLYVLRCAVCSSPDATVITVYDSSNKPYNAFQYTSDGTDYYYVLDGTQTDWTDDLESIGYHVPFEAYFTTAGASGTGNTQIGGNFGYTEAPIYDAAGSTFLFDLTKKYTISGVYNYSDESDDLPYGRIVDRNGIAMLYPGGVRFVFRMILMLSPQTVIDAYFTNQGSSATSDTYIVNDITYTLYDASGNTIPYDATKTYTTVAAFSVNGDTNSTGDRFTEYASYSDSILKGRANGATMMFRLVIRVE